MYKKGFTLIELMVVIGIISIISLIAIPNFQRFQTKAKQVNAKTELATIYGMEKAFYTEFGEYHANLHLIGYTPDGYPETTSGGVPCPASTAAGGPTRFYKTGFNDGSSDAPPGGITTVPCPGRFAYEANVAGIGAGPASGSGSGSLTIDGAAAIAGDNFTIESRGKPGTKEDVWRINQAKALTNLVVGY